MGVFELCVCVCVSNGCTWIFRCLCQYMNIWKPEEDVMGCLPLLLSLYSLEMECLRKHETCFFQLGHWTRKLPEFSCLLYPLCHAGVLGMYRYG